MSGSGRLFTQVARTKATNVSILQSVPESPSKAQSSSILDPLSLFANEIVTSTPEVETSSSLINEANALSSIVQSRVGSSRSYRSISGESRKSEETTRIRSKSDNQKGATNLFNQENLDLEEPLNRAQDPIVLDTDTIKNDSSTANNNIGPLSTLEDQKRDEVQVPQKDIISPEDDDSEVRIRHLSGEHKVMSIIDAFIQISPGTFMSGILYMTNYRLVFIPTPSDLLSIAHTNPCIYSWLHVPLACIDRMEKERRDRQREKEGIGMGGINLVISCKDLRQHRVTIRSRHSSVNSEYELERAIGVMSAYAFPNNMRFLFAFAHFLPAHLAIPSNHNNHGNNHGSNTSSGNSKLKHEPFDLLGEYRRMGVASKDHPLWRLSEANCQYALCNTYPKTLCVPRGCSDEELFAVANFRSGHRLPVLCWATPSSRGTSLWRGSQPKAGVSGTCSADERLLEAVAAAAVAGMAASSPVPTTNPTSSSKASSISRLSSNFPSPFTSSSNTNPNPAPVTPPSSGPYLHIADLRSRTSAMANRAAGAGYENQSNYPSSRLDFYNIPNIHVMRDSHKSLSGLLLNPTAHPTGDVGFSKQVEDSQWLSHLRLVLKSSWEVAQHLLRSVAVFVHCSHGWDRTAQVCSLAELMLDPFYRTMRGFRSLVEKEWCSFGHPFQMRCAHGQDRQTRQEDQVSPIFLQFLDCVWQLQKHCPQHFEFGSRFLLCIADHIYSGRFGTFLFSNDHDRDMFQESENCVDIWTYLEWNRSVFLNPLYSSGTVVVMPPLPQLLRGVSLWTDYFLRWSSVQSLPEPPAYLTKYFHRHGLSVPLVESREVADQETLSPILSDSTQPPSPVPPGNNNSSSVGNGNSTADLDVFAMQCSQDYWEGAYRMERCRRIRTNPDQHALGSASVDSQAPNVLRESPSCENFGESEGRDKQIIAELVQLIHDKASHQISSEEVQRILVTTTTTSSNNSSSSSSSISINNSSNSLRWNPSHSVIADNNGEDDSVGVDLDVLSAIGIHNNIHSDHSNSNHSGVKGVDYSEELARSHSSDWVETSLSEEDEACDTFVV